MRYKVFKANLVVLGFKEEAVDLYWALYHGAGPSKWLIRTHPTMMHRPNRVEFAVAGYFYDTRRYRVADETRVRSYSAAIRYITDLLTRQEYSYDVR